MSKNGWITIVVIIVIILLGWAIFGSMGNKSATGPEASSTDLTVNTPPATNNPQATAPGATGLTSTTLPPTPVNVRVRATNYSFDIKSIKVNEGDTVNLTLVDGNGTHDLKIDGYNVGTRMLNGGEEQTITFVADKVGTFQYYCSVGNHRAMGMVGNLEVVKKN